MAYAELDGTHDPVKEVSPMQSLWAGMAAFVAGAVVAGTSHFAGTAKALEEEGISKAQRLRALPTAAKALAVSTVACVGFGAVGYFGLRQAGFDVKDKAGVASLHDAISLAEEQRELVRGQFRKRLHQWNGSEEQARQES